MRPSCQLGCGLSFLFYNIIVLAIWMRLRFIDLHLRGKTFPDISYLSLTPQNLSTCGLSHSTKPSPITPSSSITSRSTSEVRSISRSFTYSVPTYSASLPSAPRSFLVPSQRTLAPLGYPVNTIIQSTSSRLRTLDKANPINRPISPEQ